MKTNPKPITNIREKIIKEIEDWSKEDIIQLQNEIQQLLDDIDEEERYSQ